MEERHVNKRALGQLEKSLSGLWAEFEELLAIADKIDKKENEKGGFLFDVDKFEAQDRQRFLDWHEKFKNLIANTAELGVIDQEFMDKYQNYTPEQWAKDPEWLRIQQEIAEGKSNLEHTYSEKIAKLERQMSKISSSYNWRVDEVYKPAALWGFVTAAVPLIMATAYIIDSIVKYLRVDAKKDKKASLENAKAAVESDIVKQDVKKSFYSQAAHVGTAETFFKPMREEAKKGEKDAAEEAKTEESSSISNKK